MKRIAAASVAVIRDGRFLLVKRGRGAARGQYAFPGGRTEPGETAEQTARRELLEETGLIVDSLDHLRRIEIDAGEILYVLDVFVTCQASGDAIAGDDADAAGWFSVDEMDGLDITLSTLEIARELAASQCSPTAAK